MVFFLLLLFFLVDDLMRIRMCFLVSLINKRCWTPTEMAKHCFRMLELMINES